MPQDPPEPNTMVHAFAVLCLGLGITALELFAFLDSQNGAGAGATTNAHAQLLQSAAEVLPPLAAVGFLFVAVAFTQLHLTHRHVAGAGNSGPLVIFVLCVSAGVLDLILFTEAAAAGVAQVRALGLAALRALPAAATVTFFSGMMLIIVSHVRAGGEGGGTGAVAGGGPIRLLTKIAARAVAALVCVMAVALITLYGDKS